MKLRGHSATFVAALGAALALVPALAAQQAVEAPSGKTLAATMDVYAFPKSGQDATTQSKDEAACYQWAVENTGNDPFQLQKQAQAQQQQAESSAAAASAVGTGAGARGAAGGAAAGALIGAIAGDAGEGAAYGAAAGLLAGRRRGRMARHEAEASVEASAAQAQQATAQDIENFKKAFSACLEAKDYLVKF